jgi:hypothetical protein
MGKITDEVWQKYPRERDLIPEGILDRIDQAEVLDRLDEARDLYAKADATTHGPLARGFVFQARRVCQAEPREDTERQAQVWVDKADAAHTLEHAETCLEKATAIRAENPPAPRRTRPGPSVVSLLQAQAVAKLKADVRTAADAERAQWAREDTAVLNKVDAAPDDAPVTRGELKAMVRRAMAEARAARVA